MLGFKVGGQGGVRWTISIPKGRFPVSTLNNFSDVLSQEK